LLEKEIMEIFTQALKTPQKKIEKKKTKKECPISRSYSVVSLQQVTSVKENSSLLAKIP